MKTWAVNLLTLTTFHFNVMAISIKEEGLQNHIEALGYDYEEFNRDMQLELPIRRIATILTKLAGKSVLPVTVSKWAGVWRSERKHVDI